MRNKNWWFIGFALISGCLYFYLFYFLRRVDHLELTLSYTSLFAIYLWIYKNKAEFNLNWILILAVVFRLLPLIAVPQLSDDFYRFIWDGRLWAAGINPFANIPEVIINYKNLPGRGITQELFSLLNSPTHYTVYPPIPQFINLIAAKFFPNSILGSIIVLRISILMAELLAIFYLVKLMNLSKQDSRLVVIYALNPLVIIELSGNLHHEALMIAFLLGFFFFWQKQKIVIAGSMFALAVASKLLPLLFLPYLVLKMKKRKEFLITVFVVSGILFLPLLERSFFIGMIDSLTLYYQRFEFNAGLYYFVREVGFWIYGYNTIAVIGKLFFVVSLVLILALSFRFTKADLPKIEASTLLYLLFCLFSLILHPWYILLLVALAPLNQLRFSMVWSYLIFFTYWGYSEQGFSENYFIVAIEYCLLFAVLFSEWRSYDRSRETLNEVP